MGSAGTLRGIVGVDTPSPASLLLVLIIVATGTAQYSGGNGTAGEPYRIATAADLIALGETPEDYDKQFILTADIDLDPNLPGRRVFDKAVIAPTGETTNSSSDPVFAGTFDGNGHVIYNLTIRGYDCLGLFGQLSSIAVISNLGLEAVEIHGRGSLVGGLAGDNDGSISNSYSTGMISGNEYVGGLVGYNPGNIISSNSTGAVSGDSRVGGLVGANSWGRIVNSYSTGTASGNSRIGGLVGFNSGSISTSYSTGVVSGYSSIGGLVGSIWRWDLTRSGSSTSCFWDVQTSGQTTSDGGAGLTTAQMQDMGMYLGAGWDFAGEAANGTCDFWQMSPGKYPELSYLEGDGPVMPEGQGTEEEPYLIRNARDLGTAWFKPTAHYRLEASIDVAAITWSGAVVPCFLGSFDGNGHTISNLHVEGGNYVGMIGQLGIDAAISHVGLKATDVNGTGDYVGAIVGENSGSITNCSGTGTVTGGAYVGGLAGSNPGSISTSCSDCTLNGDWTVGGLVGANLGSITDCHSTGIVSGIEWVGNLAGWNSGDISHSYSTGTVSGARAAGGLVGQNDGPGNIVNSYSTSTVSGGASVGGLAGYNFGSISNSYGVSAVSGILSVGGLVGTNVNSITSCHSAGTVGGDSFVGGLVGENVAHHGLYGSISNSYSTCVVGGNVSVGGLVGTTLSSITNCYSTGVVTGSSNVGGLVGEIGQSSTSWGRVVASFWNIETSDRTTSAGGTGKTTAEMQTAGTFLDAGWDFVGETDNGTDDIWWILEGQDYPRLWWEAPTIDD